MVAGLKVMAGRDVISSANLGERMHSYADIAEELERRIGTGELPPGSKLPSYSELAGEFRVAITTASHAIRILRYKGLVKGFQGKGVYVLPLPDDF